MRLYRAKITMKKTYEFGIYEIIPKGQLFVIDSYIDLPYYDELTFKKDWEELELQTRHGQTKLVIINA